MGQNATAEVRGRGEITIPKKVRESYQLETGQALTFLSLGEAGILLTPKGLELEEARRQIRRIIKQTGKSEKVILKGLQESREKTFKKHYPRLS